MATDYSQLGSFATGAAAGLNGELIQKLYDAESSSRVSPIETSIELIATEKEKMTEINGKVNELLEAIKPFDLYAKAGNRAFEQVSASATGTSVFFDASDVNSLKEGSYTVDVTQLAQKDVWQSNAQTLTASKTAMAAETLSINTASGTAETFDTDGLTLAELAAKINTTSVHATASVEQTGDDSYRLILKSKEPGTANALEFAGAAATTLGYNDASSNPIAANRVLDAQNMNATVDGVAYDVSSNSIQVDGNLKITAAETGISTLSITKDDSGIIPAVQEMATKYNELLTLITEELYSDDPSVQDTSTLKDIVNGIKSMIYGEYGEKQNSLLNFGITFDDVGNTGLLEVDTTILGNALLEDSDAVKDLFLGTPVYDVDGDNPSITDERGFGTLLKAHLDSLNSYPDGLFNSYTDNMDARELRLKEEKEKAVETLDTKYDTMAAQFAAYATIIAQMEASFAGLQQIIASENSSD